MNSTGSLIRVLLLLAFVVAISLPLSGCSADTKEELQPQAWAFMVQKVTEKLGSPGNLTFPADGVNSVTPVGDNRFQVTAYADFTNKQGEKDRSYFYGTVVSQNGVWRLEELKFSQ